MKKAFAGAILTVLIVGILGCAPLAEYQPKQMKPEQQEHFEAWGTVRAKGPSTVPGYLSRPGRVDQYLEVDFETDDGTLFIIPFRFDDMEVIPVSSPAKEVENVSYLYAPVTVPAGIGTVYWCGDGGSTTTCSTSAPKPKEKTISKVRIEAQEAHGILKYHKCEGDFYCFDSFKKTKKPEGVTN